MKKILSTLLFWLLLVNIFALLALNRLNLKGDSAYTWIDPLKYNQEQSWNPNSLHARWDSSFYIDIAQHGYHLTPGDTLSNIVFFPLYPFLMYLLAPLVGLNFVLAGWLISIFSLIGSVVIFYKLLKEFHPTIDIETPIFYLLIFPTAFFLNAVYTESLFLLLSLLAFYYIRKGRFGLAGVFGLFAALTRITGILLFLPLAWEFFKKHGVRKMFSLSFIPILLTPLGTFLFFLYHRFVFGDFLIFFKIESAWGRAFQFNKDHFLLFSHPALANILIDFLFLVLVIMAICLMFKRKWVSYGLYTLATIGVALSTGTSMSIGRYILVLFPIYIALATVKNRNFEKIYTLISILLLALNITLFVNGYWAG